MDELLYQQILLALLSIHNELLIRNAYDTGYYTKDQYKEYLTTQLKTISGEEIIPEKED